MNVLHLSPYLDSVPCLRTFTCDLGHHFSWKFHNSRMNGLFLKRKLLDFQCVDGNQSNRSKIETRVMSPEMYSHVTHVVRNFITVIQRITLNKAVRVMRVYLVL